ncbi:hexose-6-phosphate dehydrogenase [Sarotherodon galilaeus]
MRLCRCRFLPLCPQTCRSRLSKGSLKIKNYIDVTFSATMKKTSFLYCFLYVTLIDGDVINVEEFEGRSVSFQCSHTFAWSNKKYFCKDPCTSTGDILVTVESGGRAESGRIALVDSGDGFFTVTFSNLQLSDSQKYWCAVERTGFDTYAEIHLTVKNAVATVTAVIPGVATWTNQNTNTTNFTTGTGTMKPIELSTALNFTAEEEPKINTDTIMFATVGSVGLVSILLLAVCFWKSRKTSKHKQSVYSKSADLTSANKREVSCGYDDTDKRKKGSTKSPKSSSVSAHQQREDPLTSDATATKCSVLADTDQNISFTKLPECSGYSLTEDQNDYENNSGIYINTLPAFIFERTDDGACRKQITEPNTSKNTLSCANRCVSRAPCESNEEKRSLWFGLDLSEIKEN